MRRHLTALIVLAAVVVTGCSDDTPTAPVGSVTFVPNQSSFTPQDDITATITNRTAGTIFVENRCPAPHLEVFDGAQWQLARIEYTILCIAEFSPPVAVCRRASYEVRLDHEILVEALPAGQYRFSLAYGQDADQVDVPLVSGAFSISTTSP